MIEVSHVSAGYGGQDVLKDLSFSLPQGEVDIRKKRCANQRRHRADGQLLRA